ncbi:MAG: outer membrane beta-barrel domain-containing protein, partial [Ectothiorhodospiraceae bacterium]|nr:outer membrane beta-barrel domain-containing protein [Ectothiorhodospiraceae bacterium]
MALSEKRSRLSPRAPVCVLLLVLLTAGMPPAHAQVPEPRQRDGAVIEPPLERPEVVIPRIDTENFEFNAFAGVLSIQSFGTEPVYGARAAFHLTESFFLEGTYAQSSIRDRSYRRLGIPLFESEKETVTYYNVSLLYNALPGEVFPGRSRAFTSALYLAIGAGNTRIADEDYFTYSLGLGARVLPTDWFSLRVDLR